MPTHSGASPALRAAIPHNYPNECFYSSSSKIEARIYRGRFKGALCAYLIRLRLSSNQNDETLSRNSLMYMSKANLLIALNE